MVPSSYRHFFLSRYKKSIAVAASLTHSLPSYIVLPLLPPPSSLSEAIQKIHQKPFSHLSFEITIASDIVLIFCSFPKYLPVVDQICLLIATIWERLAVFFAELANHVPGIVVMAKE